MTENQTIRDRIMAIIDYYNLNGRQFERSIGVSNGYLNSIKTEIGSEKLKKILEVYPEINGYWLITGESSMITKESQVVIQNNSSNNSSNSTGDININGSEYPLYDREKSEFNPIIPSSILKTPNLDVLLYINNNKDNLEQVPIKLLDIHVDMWLRLLDNSLAPKYSVGDLLALIAYPQGEEHIIPGEPYVVDTKNNGIITRVLYNNDDETLLAHSNNEDYPDFKIKKEEIFRIYKIIFSVRF